MKRCDVFGFFGIAIVASIILTCLNLAQYDTLPPQTCRPGQAIWLAVTPIGRHDDPMHQKMLSVLEALMYGINCTFIAYRRETGENGYTLRTAMGPIGPDELYKIEDFTHTEFIQHAAKAAVRYPGGVTFVMVAHDNYTRTEDQTSEMTKTTIAKVMYAMGTYLVPMTINEMLQNSNWLARALAEHYSGCTLVTLDRLRRVGDSPLVNAWAFAELATPDMTAAPVFGGLLREYIMRQLFFSRVHMFLYDVASAMKLVARMFGLVR